MGYTVLDLADRLRSEGDAYKFMEELRWGDGEAVCPHCANLGASYIEPANGVSRKTRTGNLSERRVWRCFSCRKQFSVTTGTVFHGSKVALRIWVLVIFEMCSSKNGVSAREVERKYGVCARTAWFMMHRIREAMTRDNLVAPMQGRVQADETFIGGLEKNRHASKKHFPAPADGPYEPGSGFGPRWRDDKTAVLSLIDADTGEARSRIVPNVTGATLSKAMSEMGVNKAETVLHTDGLKSYRKIAGEFAAHEYVDHEDGEYVRDGVSTNMAENFFSQLKRSLDGTHHHVSKEHLSRYLAEYDYRFSTRKESDTARMQRLMGQVHGKRLTYKRVTA
jgi:transposase-like protein